MSDLAEPDAPLDPRSPTDRQETTELDLLIIGGGVTGIHQLYLAVQAGWSVRLVDAGDGPGGTWFWNRYPGARFDSESYSYGFLFSRELYEEWEWSEHYAGQPETERYFNHVVDRFDLRRHMRFGATVVGAHWDGEAARWHVETSDGSAHWARHVVAATGVLSVPYFPAIEGRADFGGESHHTGRWPATGVDVTDKRVAVIGTGSSGVQVVPAMVDEVASLTVYQRSANWCTPLNNSPVTPAQQAELRVNFPELKEKLDTSLHGFLHEAHDRSTFDDDAEARRAFYERMWASPGFTKLTSNYLDLTLDPAANAEWCAFIADKIRAIVSDPATAEKLIPTDHGYSEKRPPFVTGYYEAFNNPKVRLVSLAETPITRITATGVETTAGHEEFDVIVWATGWDFGTGALHRLGIVGPDGPLTDRWADGPRTFLGLMTHGFPNLFFPGGPHAAAGNNPRYNGDQVEFVHELLERMRARGEAVVAVTADAEERWTDMVDRGAEHSPFGEGSYYFGANIPGKPRKYLLNSGGRPKLFKEFERVRATDYAAFVFDRAG
ncbi:flavin-containing monooxygenase [Candidatus Poriferisocius sp.]|uniref:flavin-containing monooxygenase n=1 Tax=Candidatus Poriferisocius sp. TaxID=3101276 RepID=UPI003B58EE36